MTATNSVPSSLILYQSKHRFVASCGHRVMALMAELLPDLHGLFQHNFEEIWNFNPSRQLQNQHYCQTNAFLTTCLQESLQVSPELQPDLESNSSASVLTAAFASLQSSSL